MIIIPSRENKIITQTNRSKVLGTLWSSFNLDLESNLGTFRIPPVLRINLGGDTNQGRMVAARTFDGRVFAICGTRIFKNSSQDLITAFAEESIGSSATDFDALYSDMENFNTVLIATTVDAVLSKASNGSGTGAWTSRATLSATTSPHKLCYFQKYNRIYYLDGDYIVKSMDTSWSEATSGDYSLTTNSNQGLLKTMAVDVDNMWFGTFNVVPSNTLKAIKGASILRWDGITAGAIFQYPIKASGVLALCCDDSGIMHAIDTNGSLLRFNGAGFTEIDRLPIDKKLLKNAGTLGYNNFIHPNGMVLTRNGTFKILVNNLVGDSAGTIIENLPSGVWEWSKDKGFVHHNSAHLTAIGSSTPIDYGQNRVSAVGALYEPNLYSESASGKATTLCGIDYYTDATTVVSGIFADDPLDTNQKYGYFVTSWIFSQGLKDTWQRVWLKVRQLLDADDEIVVKYRMKESAPVEGTITWVNTTSFTTALDLSTFAVGDEVEVTQGRAGGLCAHITALQSVEGGYSVTVDKVMTGATTTTGKARFQKWIKAGTFDSQSDELASFTIDKPSSRIQLKVCMQFKGEDEVFELALVNKTDQELV